MNKDTINILCKQFEIEKEVINYINDKEQLIKKDFFSDIDDVKEYNQYKVIIAMQKAKLNSSHFGWTTGYGYDDIGRDKVEEVYSYVFDTEDALVRPTIVSGTHAITLTLSGILKPNDELIYITGSPYDTLKKVIGIEGDMSGTLIDYGIKYKEVPLTKNNEMDIDAIINSISEDTKMIAIQRSTGYSDRNAFTIDQIKKSIDAVKRYNEDIIVFIDNCYGEFIEKLEPSNIGADIMAGSLIKNPGGGLALTGGYVVGRKDLIELVANRSTAPGIGKECGLTFGMTRTVLQGLFLAPHVVSESLKGSLLTAAVYKGLGFRVVPDLYDKRSDIIQGIEFESSEKMIKFCQGIQSASPVDSYFAPIPSEMPGYKDEVIMAAGAFVQGSSIELSADGPVRDPFFAYYQGGLTYEHCKLGVMKSLNNLYTSGLVNII
ncbi:putative aluminum resistance protein [Gottschalkia acidurici 9a]|uniref:Aluminum resistance protein n=1 Tax=Gottschalkia acidurici (strain ATCC 7906 / DSM 604 / BCRC 14475 / CIP 104303 / KCTC 5404 / NCIMB 10678 / 9a) TaxID=1128398 RepID=K0AXI4_GOTA9|nr:methionine gamma-lyase family protein [Gottschalkia acidurici]AFS78533.1 putative aluminum resistance protein [Gottschalkia acidurici 9a]